MHCNRSADSSRRGLPVSFAWLNTTQFLGALNDNIFKFLLVFFLIDRHGAGEAGTIAAKAGTVFVIPFLIFSSAAGILADRISKRRILVGVKVVEVIVMLFGTFAFFREMEGGLYAVLFLMASQSAWFGPSKYGVVPELVRKEELSRANSLLESFTYLAIVLGSALAPFLAQITKPDYGAASIFCIAVALTGWAASQRIKPTSAAGSEKAPTLFFVREILETLREIRPDGFLLLAVVGSAYFLFLGAFAQINLIPYGMETLHLTQEQSGYLFLVAALGIGMGSFLSGKLSGRNVEFGVVPIGAVGLTASSLLLYLLPSRLGLVIPSVILFGLSAGLFIVPLQSFIQFRSPRKKLGQVLAASGFLSWVGVLIASGLAYFLNGPMGLSAAQGFLVVGCLTLILTLITWMTLPDFLIRFFALLAMKLAYRIRVLGAENVPVEGPALLVSNHVSWIDALLLTATQQRRIRFVMERGIYNTRFLKPFFRLMGVLPVSSHDSRAEKVAFFRDVRIALDQGYMVCIFAEGAITRNGRVQEFRPGLEHILRGTRCPVVPVYIGGVWGSLFSYAHGRFPAKAPRPVTIVFGEPLPESCRAQDVRNAVLELSPFYPEEEVGL